MSLNISPDELKKGGNVVGVIVVPGDSVVAFVLGLNPF